ncbi:uncharacterized protein Dwil_GK15255 [Drosophila willistoni]|uniref:COMM domain-containing protein 5 n=1 Tax=Drosophila willistoni TaxID=7260 RepID=B4MUB6_DROWI|nr:COMM domain-containing protein 5 [Drosophila willistoni]EDW76042.1 uncharacterized protein Dwil_GK15255 [Drosophila willistoni]
MDSFRNNMIKSARPYAVFVPQLNKSVLRVLIQVSVHYIENKKSSPNILALAINKLSNAGHEVPENFCELFTLIYTIMQHFLRSTENKEHELRQCLKEDLSFTDECVDDICKILINHRAVLTKNFAETKVERVKISGGLQWRINLSLSSSMTKFDNPTIVLHFKLSNGKHRTLELPLEMFQRLRYNISVLLSELQQLQSRSILKSF